MSTDAPETTSARRGRLLRTWGPTAVLLVAFIAASIAVIPRVQTHGTATLAAYELDQGQPVRGLRIRGDITRNAFGFAVNAFGSGRVSFTVAAHPRRGQRTVLSLATGAGPEAPVRASLIDRAGIRHPLGHVAPRGRVDITSLAEPGRIRLEFEATNSGAAPQLIADRVQVATYPPDAIPRAGRWEVAAWAAIAVLLALAALRRARRNTVLVIACALTAWLVWPAVQGNALAPLFADYWDSAIGAKWLDLDHGLLSGTFGGRSALTVQLFHALTPITGTGMGGARIASMLVGILAMVGIYALGRRVAGPIGAVTTVTCALLTDPFRLSLSTGDSTGTLVLASCLLLLAAHRVLERRDRASMALLGAAGAVAIVAEPLWWPGALVAIVLLSLRYVPSGQRRAALGTALAALVLLTLPSRVSVAHQSKGELNADVIERATTARNIEFVGRGHGAPLDERSRLAAPSGGPQVGLGDYVVGDHSLTVVAGGVLSGSYDGVSAASARRYSELPGLLAFLVEVVGAALLLLIPRLRLLVVVPALLALVPWFFVSREALPAFLGETAFWPALLAGAATLAYMGREALRGRITTPRVAVNLRNRATALGRRAGRRPERASR